MCRLRLVVAILIGAMLYPAQSWAQGNQLMSPTPGNLFGASVAFSGNMAVIGAPYGLTGNQGAAYVYTQTGGTWTLQAELIAPDGAGNDYFGSSVAISGTTIVVGAPNHTVGSNTYQGAVYVFAENSDGTWSLQAELSYGYTGSHFGNSVAVSGGTVVVGEVYQDTILPAVYVFVQSGGTWSLQATLSVPNGVTNEYLGGPVAVSGSTIVVGGNSVPKGGTAYVFVQSGGVWSLQAALTGSDETVGDGFGSSVAVDGSTLVVGDIAHPYSSTSGDGPGAAYVFVDNGGTWSQQAELTASDGVAGDDFGISAAVSGSTVVVGASRHPFSSTSGSGPGAAYVFVDNGGTWSQQMELTASGSAHSFGDSVAFDGRTILVGDQQAGAAYVFLASTTTVSSNLNPSEAGQSVALTATVAPLAGSGSPTGTVTFYFGYGGVIGTAPLSGGQASLSYSFMVASTKSIYAVYSGDSNFATSTSPTLSQVVNNMPVATTTTISSNLNPSEVGQPVILSATVAPQPGLATPTGTVTFYFGYGGVIGTAVLQNGQASLTYTFNVASTKSITAVYSGDSKYLTGTSSMLVLVVQSLPATTTTLTSSTNPSALNQSVTVTATITGGNGGPTGTITFAVNGSDAATVPVSSGQAIYSTAFPTSSTDSITASYSGDVNNQPSTSTALRQVVSYPADTVVTLTLSRSPVSGTATPTESFIVSSAGTTTPAGVLILLPGATGNMQLTPNGSDGTLDITEMNTLIRSRWHFASFNYVVLSLDAATDFKLLTNVLTGQQGSTAHIYDIVQVIAWARTNYSGLPVWIVGTSRGTGGAFVAASNASPTGPDGLAFVSPINTSADADSVLKANLGAITVPTLIYGNSSDECPSSLPSGQAAIITALTGTPVKASQNLTGVGFTAMGDNCKELSPHGFFGQEPQMVNDVMAFVTAH